MNSLSLRGLEPKFLPMEGTDVGFLTSESQNKILESILTGDRPEIVRTWHKWRLWFLKEFRRLWSQKKGGIGRLPVKQCSLWALETTPQGNARVRKTGNFVVSRSYSSPSDIWRTTWYNICHRLNVCLSWAPNVVSHLRISNIALLNSRWTKPLYQYEGRRVRTGSRKWSKDRAR